MSKIVVYKGQIYEATRGENDDALYLSDDRHDPLADRVECDLGELRTATVRYFISDKEKPIDELTENLIKKISGAITADYGDHYSEYTGYLWTDEELNIGGHDLIDELRSHAEKYAYIEISYGGKNKS